MRLAVVSEQSRPPAEQRMWAYYVTESSKGRRPTGTELDRIAGTNNYGRRLLRQRRRQGHIKESGAVDRQHRESARRAVVSR
jgi:hypothetical protein